MHLNLWYSHVTLVSTYPFWQLSIEHNMDVYKDVHYQVKHIAYALDTWVVMPSHYNHSAGKIVAT